MKIKKIAVVVSLALSMVGCGESLPPDTVANTFNFEVGKKYEVEAEVHLQSMNANDAKKLQNEPRIETIMISSMKNTLVDIVGSVQGDLPKHHIQALTTEACFLVKDNKNLGVKDCVVRRLKISKKPA